MLKVLVSCANSALRTRKAVMVVLVCCDGAAT